MERPEFEPGEELEATNAEILEACRGIFTEDEYAELLDAIDDEPAVFQGHVYSYLLMGEHFATEDEVEEFLRSKGCFG